MGLLCLCFLLSGFAGGNNGLRKREIGRERKNKKRIKNNKERIFK